MHNDGKFAENDWIVHSYYGVGKIEAVETKTISGEENDYFRVKTTDITYWLPLDQTEDEQIRSLASPEEVDAIIAILKKSPKALSSNAKLRQTHIKEARQLNTFQSKARIIRDLHGHFRGKGDRSVNERHIYTTSRQRLIKEWSLITGKKVEQIETRLDSLLSQ